MKPKLSMTPNSLLFHLPMMGFFLLLSQAVPAGGCLATEKDALLAFKDGLNDSRHRLSSWRGQDCCRWAGVVCDAYTDHVVELKLRNTHGFRDDSWVLTMHGEINSSLLSLTELEHLDLSYNDFRLSSFPEFLGSFKKLRYLNLSNTMFIGGTPAVYMLGNLSNLQYLDLSLAIIFMNSVDDLMWLHHLSSLKYLDLSYLSLRNATDWFHSVNMLPSLRVLRLQGCELKTIPVSLTPINFSTSLRTLDISSNFLVGSSLARWVRRNVSPEHLPKLSRLILAGNRMTGNFPHGLEQMAGLKTLDLSQNLLNGSIPTWIGKLSSLTELSLSHNSFTGVVSEAHFENLITLEKLGLSYNSLEVSLSHGWTPAFQLISVELSRCQLGPGFPNWIKHQKRIGKLDLSNNGLTGMLPDWFWKSTCSVATYLDLSNNILGGNLPPSLEHLNLTELYLDSNQFEGPLPSMLPFTLRRVRLSRNFFQGLLPASICKSKELITVDLSKNNLSGELPYCLGESLHSLLILNLGNNNFAGIIPKSFTYFHYLTGLKLNDNHFTGEILHLLRNCTNLQFLDLGQNKFYGSIPSWMGERLTFLQILRLRSNYFSGEIPWQIFKLDKSLSVLDLANNNISGPIPHVMYNLTVMASTERIALLMLILDMGLDIHTKGQDLFYNVDENLRLVKSIDLSSNSLNGEIPEGIRTLKGLQNLNLSNNRLAGEIPEQLGEMKSLESLDLSRNYFVGNIPESLSTLTFLSHLNVSYNNLAGRIPSGHQLQTFENTSYIGNLGLCGPPLNDKCSNDKNGTVVNVEQHHAKDLEIIWISVSAALGFVMGFWSFYGVFVFKREWRYSYLRLIDDSYDRLCVVLQLIHLRLHGHRQG